MSVALDTVIDEAIAVVQSEGGQALLALVQALAPMVPVQALVDLGEAVAKLIEGQTEAQQLAQAENAVFAADAAATEALKK